MSQSPSPSSAELNGLTARRTKTRRALLDAGLKLMAEKAVDAIAINEIVGVAGVAKGSFFNHFEDKETFAEAVASQVRSEVEAAVFALNGATDDPASRVVRAICLYIRYALCDPNHAGVLVRASSRLSNVGAPLNQGLVADISQGLQSGRFAVPTVEAGALLVLGAAHITLARVLIEPSPSVAAALGQQLCALLLRGLGLTGSEAEGLAARAAHEVLGPTGPALR